MRKPRQTFTSPHPFRYVNDEQLEKAALEMLARLIAEIATLRKVDLSKLEEKP